MNDFILRAKTTLFLSFFAALVLVLPSWYLPVLLSLCCLFTIIYEWIPFCFVDKRLFLLTPFYPFLPYFLLIFLSLDHTGQFLVEFLFLVVASFDSGSYFCGIRFGKRLLCPTISPKKTVEGVIGGICCALLVGYGLYFFLHQTFFPPYLYLFHITLLCLIALLGDLFESALKRHVRIKDAGDLLPGHGGLLDRFDGILSAVCYLFFMQNALQKLLFN